MPRWDSSDIPSMQGKVAVVTGANSGLGLATTRYLAGAGARVIMACRNTTKAEEAAASVGPEAEVVGLDLASLGSVRRAAAEIARLAPAVDLLIDNAGLMAVDQSRTEDGFETHFGVNHLGHFALTGLLLPQLLAAEGSRVVVVSSMGHRGGYMRFDDLMFEHHRYNRWQPYAQSKLANLLFALELDRRLRAAGLSARALAAHPGATNTDLGWEGSGLSNAGVRWFARLTMPAPQGALPIVRAAVDPAARGGEFYGPHLMMFGYPVRETPSRRARDPEAARRLWDISEDLTGVHFSFA